MTTYTFAQLESLWIQAGGSTATAPVAAAIALAESGGVSNAAYPGTTVAPGQGSTTDATGLWQILGLPAGNFTAAELTDPLENAKMAVAKYEQAGNSFSPWQTYTSGAYSQYLQSGVAASSSGTSSATSSGTSSGTSAGSGSSSGTSAGGAQLTTDIGSINPLEEGLGAVGSWINLVPFLGGFVKTIADGADALGSVNHLLAYLIDYPLSMFKPGQAWRITFTAVTGLLAAGAFKTYQGSSGGEQDGGHDKLPLAILLLGAALLTGFMAFRPWPNPTGKPIKPGAYMYEILEGQVPAAGPPAVSPAEVQVTEFALDTVVAIWAMQKISGSVDNIATAIEQAKQAALGWWGNLF